MQYEPRCGEDNWVELVSEKTCEEMNYGCRNGGRNVGDGLKNTKKVESVGLGY